MSYGYSSGFPRVPNSTPQLPVSIRPPIHNPYDKFTQPQFDEWIGDITSALRKALGKDEEETLTSQPTKPREVDAHSASDTDNDNVEDSFAEWKAMRAKEKGKMRATEDEKDSEYGAQDIYEDSGLHHHAAGNTLEDAIELLSDDDDAEGDQLNAHRAYDDKDHNSGSIERPNSVEEEVEHLCVEGSQPAMPSKPYVPANATGHQAIETAGGKVETHNQADDPFEAENVSFGWGQGEQGEFQQPPDVRDPWELPKTYAEDLYTGGPIREMHRSRLSPSHLTPSTQEVGYLDDIDPQFRPSSTLVPQSADRNFSEISQEPEASALIPPTTDRVFDGDDEVSLHDEDIPGLDAPMIATLRTGSDFVSFVALNQPSDVESERGEPEVLYISDNDGEVSENGKEAEEDESDGDGLIPLGTSDLEIPAERGPEDDGGEEFDELGDDEEPVAEVSSNPSYGYYGLDASSAIGSGGIDDETGPVGPPTDAQKDSWIGVPDIAILQESTCLLNPPPLPVAATFINIGRHLESEASAIIGEATKVSLAEVSLTSLGDTPTIPGEAAVGIEDLGTADEDSVGDDTVLADEAVLTPNEVEEVLRDAFAETDRLLPASDARENTTSISDTTPFIGEQVTPTSPEPGLSNTIPKSPAGLLPQEPRFKDEDNLIGSPPWIAKDELPDSQEARRSSLPFVMPLIANPNVRDPMSAPWSPVQSGPPTPVASLACLPAVTKFKRDNQLLDVVHSSSGLFTPLEGSGSPAPSPSDTASPEGRPGVEAETEIPVVDDDEQHNATPTGLPGDGGWEEIPRLSLPPAEIVDHVEGTLTATPATRVFFQPVKPSDSVEGFDAQSEANSDDGVRDDDGLPLIHPSVDATKGSLEGNDVPSVSSPSPDERTPRLKIPALAAEDSSRAREDSDTSAKVQNRLKRKRSASPIRSVPLESECSGECNASDMVITSLRNGERGGTNHEKEPRKKEEDHDSDNESFASSQIAPRNADLSSHDGSRASSVVSEQPLLLQGRTPVPDDAPVFHGHGKFKAALQALKLLRQKSENLTQEPEREKGRPVVTETRPKTSSENGPMGSTEAKTPPPLVIPTASTQLSQPSTSTPQSPMTPTSALPSSPSVITAPAEVTTPHKEQAVQEPAEPGRDLIKKSVVKTTKRNASRKSSFFEPKSTRSQCRYRKISLPREENGPRVTFCVPQCSLNDKELMEEEDITDDGLATVRDFERLWDHVEEQDLSPYLIGVIRKLVGLDLLRENEIYYLPANEEVRLMGRKQKRGERRKSRKSIGGAASVESASLTRSVSATGPTPQPSLSQAEGLDLPPSLAESASTASTPPNVNREGSTRSVSGDEMTDDGRNGRTKRRRTGKERDGGSLRNTPSVREDSVASSTAGSPTPSQLTAERTPARRSQRTLKKAISTDAQAYKPTFSSGESSEDGLENAKKKRKSMRGVTKSLKRRRTDGVRDSSTLPTTGGVGGHDTPLSPRSTRSKRAKIDEK